MRRRSNKPSLDRGARFSRSETLLVLFFAALLVGGAAIQRGSAQTAPTPARVESQARALEGRLHAPCCRNLMFEGHESDQTRELRREIRARFLSGETEPAIERELRERYGDAIVAVPSDRDPRPGLSAALAALLAGSVMLLVLLGRRWMRRTQRATATALAPQPADAQRSAELDAQLDRELRNLDS
jgi:cytochrome c-type biogenesis protein CcmH